jgi:hypothetical protein
MHDLVKLSVEIRQFACQTAQLACHDRAALLEQGAPFFAA